jgi:hypothetical protein
MTPGRPFARSNAAVEAWYPTHAVPSPGRSFHGWVRQADGATEDG